MRNRSDQKGPINPAAQVNAAQSRPSWDLPSLGGVLTGSVMFVTGGALLFTVIGIPLGIPLFAAGLGLMLEPKPKPKTPEP